MKKILRFLVTYLILTLLILLLPYLFSRAMSGGRQVKIAQNPRAHKVPSTKSDSITIAAYNIAHGRGLVYKNWNGESETTRLERLDQLADVIRQTKADVVVLNDCLLYTSPSPRDRTRSRMPSSA